MKEKYIREEKNYQQQIENVEKVLLVGISYDAEKHHTCKIEMWEKQKNRL